MSTTTSAPRRLFGKSGGPGKAEPPKKSGGGKRLSREDRRQIEAAIAKAKRTDKKELSAQDSFPLLLLRRFLLTLLIYLVEPVLHRGFPRFAFAGDIFNKTAQIQSTGNVLQKCFKPCLLAQYE